METAWWGQGSHGSAQELMPLPELVACSTRYKAVGPCVPWWKEDGQGQVETCLTKHTAHSPPHPDRCLEKPSPGARPDALQFTQPTVHSPHSALCLPLLLPGSPASNSAPGLASLLSSLAWLIARALLDMFLLPGLDSSSDIIPSLPPCSQSVTVGKRHHVPLRSLLASWSIPYVASLPGKGTWIKEHTGRGYQGTRNTACVWTLVIFISIKWLILYVNLTGVRDAQIAGKMFSGCVCEGVPGRD